MRSRPFRCSALCYRRFRLNREHTSGSASVSGRPNPIKGSEAECRRCRCTLCAAWSCAQPLRTCSARTRAPMLTGGPRLVFAAERPSCRQGSPPVGAGGQLSRPPNWRIPRDPSAGRRSCDMRCSRGGATGWSPGSKRPVRAATAGPAPCRAGAPSVCCAGQAVCRAGTTPVIGTAPPSVRSSSAASPVPCMSRPRLTARRPATRPTRPPPGLAARG